MNLPEHGVLYEPRGGWSGGGGGGGEPNTKATKLLKPREHNSDSNWHAQGDHPLANSRSSIYYDY